MASRRLCFVLVFHYNDSILYSTAACSDPHWACLMVGVTFAKPMTGGALNPGAPPLVGPSVVEGDSSKTTGKAKT